MSAINLEGNEGDSESLMRAKTYKEDIKQRWVGKGLEFLSKPIVVLIICVLLFGFPALISVMKTFTFIPLNIWIVIILVAWSYHWLGGGLRRR